MLLFDEIGSSSNFITYIFSLTKSPLNGISKSVDIPENIQSFIGFLEIILVPFNEYIEYVSSKSLILLYPSNPSVLKSIKTRSSNVLYFHTSLPIETFSISFAPETL